MKISPHPQHSDEWFQARAGIITASCADALLTPLFKVKEGKAVETYLAKKLSEKWTGRPLPEDMVNTMPMEFGNILEQIARPFYELATSSEVQAVGLITNDSETIGCSPDGFIENVKGLEIKCPNATHHVKYLLAGKLPEDYVVQVHFSMFVTGLSKWDFMSFKTGMPPLILTIERDEKADSAISKAVSEFAERMNAGWQKLISLNGGKLPVKQKTVSEYMAEQSQPAPEKAPDDFDVTP